MRRIRPQWFTGTTNPEPQAYEGTHRKLARRAAAEGMAVLKNEKQVLPLPAGSKVALYGAGVSQTIKGGTGSGDVNERECVTIYQGMKDGGYVITNEAWIAAYDQMYQEARLCWKEAVLRKMEENTEKPLDFFTAYSTTPFYLPAGPGIGGAKGETAIYVLSRIAGENADRICREGDYLLSEEEEELLGAVCTSYEKVIVVINTGGLVDLSFMDQHENIYGLIQMMQPGMEGGHGFCDIVSGKVTPSGKLTDTWAMDYWDYPNAEMLAQHREEAGQEKNESSAGQAAAGQKAKDGSGGAKITEEIYGEGIYMGYRYFDTFQIPVRYSFGYGLSYTEFVIEQKKVSLITGEGQSDDLQIAVEVLVTNAGSQYKGREVVQVYVSLPEGRLDKEYRRLCGFKKTRELAPRESEVLTIDIPVESMTSYDEELPGWVLEEGYYGLWIGESLAEAKLSAMLSLCKQTIWKKTEALCPNLTEMFVEKVPPKEMVHRRYQDWVDQGKEGSLPVLAFTEALAEREEKLKDRKVKEKSTGERKTEGQKLKRLEKEAEEILSRLSVQQMIKMVCGESNIAVNSNLGSAGTRVPGSAGETSSSSCAEGVATISLADGPAGLRLNPSYLVKEGKILPLPFEASIERGFFCPPQAEPGEGETRYFQYCTAIPVGTLLAQSWDVELLEEVGAMIGEEMERFDVTLWLAPGMNLHRNPLCGRNFEYFSEDPFISGKMAAAITRGVQSHSGCGTTIKHFACNNQENNRMNSNSILSERAFRELYAKGFEIAVKESWPLAMMTSYNLINGVHAANSHDLCTRLAREEWGFQGVIMTDWTTTEVDESCTAAGCVRAGNDLIMPGSLKDYENLQKELEEGTLSVDALKLCVKRILILILQSNRYETKEK